MHFNDKPLAHKKPASTSVHKPGAINYYSGYKDTNHNFEQTSFKPVIRYANGAKSAGGGVCNLENKSFSSSISSSSSSSSSSTSACQSDNLINQQQHFNMLHKVTSPSAHKKLSVVGPVSNNIRTNTRLR